MNNALSKMAAILSKLTLNQDGMCIEKKQRDIKLPNKSHVSVVVKWTDEYMTIKLCWVSWYAQKDTVTCPKTNLENNYMLQYG